MVGSAVAGTRDATGTPPQRGGAHATSLALRPRPRTRGRRPTRPPRSVRLAGVNANHPLDRRTGAWMRMTQDLRPAALDAIVHRVPFADLIAHCDALIAGGIRGRAVVCF